MRITEKILLLFLPTFMLSVVVVGLLSRSAAERILIADVVAEGRSLATALARSPGLATGLRHGRAPVLQQVVADLQARAAAGYVALLDPRGQVLAQTRDRLRGGAADDAETRALLAAEEIVETERAVGEDRVIELAVPVWRLSGDTIGDTISAWRLALGVRPEGRASRVAILRVGLPLTHALAAAERISKRVLWIVTVVNLVAMGLILFFVRRILRPIRAMAAATEGIAAGRLGASVPVESRDEMGELAHSFNRMSKELATTTVSVDFLDSILHNMRDILVVTNADGSVRRVNRTALELLGYEEGDVIGRSARRLFAADDAHLLDAESVIEIERGAAVQGRETAMIRASGEPVPVIASVAPFQDRDGERAGFIVTAADITERKRAESHLRRSLEEKEILLRQIHHRVKNNLQIFSSLLNLQANRLDDPVLRDLCDDSQRRVQSMALIHEKLYRSDDLARVDLSDYLHALVMAAHPSQRRGPHEVQVRVDVASEIRLGIDQAIPVGLVVNELLSNALKHAFGDRGGTVVIAVHRLAAGRHRLVVADDGCGLPPDVDVHAGDTLGLKLVSVLVRQLGGRLAVEAGAEGGTRFRVDFELRTGVGGTDAEADAADDAGTAVAATLPVGEVSRPGGRELS